MAISKIVQNSIDETSVSLGVKITNVQVANSSYVIKDDTAVNVGGGFIVITGNGFKSNPQVIIGQNTACSITFIDSTTIRAEVPAKDAGTYPVYVINNDGAVGIRVPGLTYSGFPTWVTGSTLPDQLVDEAISIQLEATGANTYVLQTGSTLPTGMVLNTANGLLSGTVTGVEDDTLFNFTIEAIDTENQESPRAFNVTITVSDEYFNQTVLLLDGDGTNGANNNVFRDSSNNNFAITRNGNTTQGTFSPFSKPDGRWGNHFDGTGDYLTIDANSAFDPDTSDFTIEAWVFNESTDVTNSKTIASSRPSSIPNNRAWAFTKNTSNLINFLGLDSGGSTVISITTTSAISTGTWNHVAAVKSGNTWSIYLNGIFEVSNTQTNVISAGSTLAIGKQLFSADRDWNGYISNLRIVKDTAVYTANFTPPTAPLTAITNTSLLTCQSNRFIDNSANAFTITRNGNVRVTPFSPFAPTAAYSASVNGGSAYFRGASNADGLTAASNTAFNLSNGNFTVEAWVYPTATFTVSDHGIFSIGENLGTRKVLQFNAYDTNKVRLSLSSNGSSYDLVSLQDATTVNLNSWTHLAVVRNGATVTVWRNGSNVAAFGVSTSSLFNDTELGVSVGNYRNSGSLTASSWPGYISGVRLLKGTALYTTAFTPPTEPPSPITDTQLILNSTNAGILDYTGKNVLETVGDAKVNTAITKYGTGSMSFDGTGDFLQMPADPNLAFGTGDYTVEAWVYFTSISDGTLQIIYSSGESGNNFFFHADSNQLSVGTQAVFISNQATTFTTNTWYHVAACRSGTTLRLFRDGVQVGSNATDTINWLSSGSTGARIGANQMGTQTLFGFIDDLRVTKGVARYTTTFTPPTSAYKKK